MSNDLTLVDETCIHSDMICD